MAAQKVQHSEPSNQPTASVDETGLDKEPSSMHTAAATNTPDFELRNCGSLFLLHPLNSAAKEWMQEHLPVDSPETQFWGEAIVIESRYLEPITEGILADRLVLR
jgi:hypothetical protein